MGSRKQPFLQRLWRKIEICGPTDCWPWTGHKNGGGYGLIRLPGERGRTVAHRALFIETKGPVPPHLEVLHVCDNPSCCNPAHLRRGTHAQNMADMARKGRARSGGRPSRMDKMLCSQAAI